MADDPNQPMPMDFDALDRVVRGRGATNPCPLCAADDWKGGGDLALVQRAVKVNPGEVAAPEHGLPSLLYVCGNCGFVRQHMLFVLGEV
jgi:hypothetical protein